MLYKAGLSKICLITNEPVPAANSEKVLLGALYETRSAENVTPDPVSCVLLFFLNGSYKLIGAVSNNYGVTSNPDAEINPLGSEPLSCV